ncbi:hypothetical protein BDR05DRAFT_963648 [Suillus weaverae]|nr:hypothetical protein BDR05DRAFT_963648 [Suillus weaverae]
MGSNHETQPASNVEDWPQDIGFFTGLLACATTISDSCQALALPVFIVRRRKMTV